MEQYEDRDKQREKDFVEYFKLLFWQEQEEILFELKKISKLRLNDKKGD